VKNKSFNIRHKNKSNSDLIIVKQKKLNLLQKSSKKFSKENIEPCYSESLTIKTRETYEDPLPNYRLSKKKKKIEFITKILKKIQ
jgi:accessory colonization factor AcfC